MDEKTFRLTELEELVLLAVQANMPRATSNAVSDDLEAAGRKVLVGPMFEVLGRLVDRGFLEFEMGGPTPQRGGKARRLYSITGLGETALGRSAAPRQRLVELKVGRLGL